MNEKELVFQEADNSGVPKNFMIRCHRCRWARRSSGISVDLVDLIEIKQNCEKCGKFRQFKCPVCSGPSLMKRVSNASASTCPQPEKADGTGPVQP